MGFTAGVLGASGYTGGEIVRLLAGHPALTVVTCGAHSHAGEPIADVQPHLRGATDDGFVALSEAAAAPVDVCFSCLPTGALAGLDVVAEVVIDLSDEHRADAEWTYGLVEHARDAIAGAKLVANPGCYPTAALLCLIPFARAGLITGPIVIDAMSGVSGAGRVADDAFSFSSLHGSVGAYGTTAHRHVPEMEAGLARYGSCSATVSFTPHLVPTVRGLLVTARARLGTSLSDVEAIDVLRDAYADERFVTVVDDWPATKSVVGTNRALVSARVDERAGFLIASAAIDNLGKGAAGQAIQNANVTLGLDEAAGLEALAAWP